MLNLTGVVLNVFEQEGGTNKKGEVYESRSKIQLLGELELPNGDIKKDLIDLTVSDIAEFRTLVGKTISIAVGAIASGRAVIFYVRKGAKAVVF